MPDELCGLISSSTGTNFCRGICRSASLEGMGKRSSLCPWREGPGGTALWCTEAVEPPWGSLRPRHSPLQPDLLPFQVPPDQRDPRLPQLPPLVGEARLRLTALGARPGTAGAAPGPPRAVPGGGVPGLPCAGPARARSPAPLPSPSRLCTGTGCNKGFLRDSAPSASSAGCRPRPAPRRRRHHSLPHSLPHSLSRFRSRT